MDKQLKDRVIIIKGAGEMATGLACRLFASNLRRILMLETASPLAVRRHVSFCEAVHEGRKLVEGIEAVRVSAQAELEKAWQNGQIAVWIDPQGESISSLRPDVLIDAILAKRNLGLSIKDAPLVIALGPGFTAGKDCHVVLETNRGHDLGRLLRTGQAMENTGIPGVIGGYTKERVLRSPGDGLLVTERMIGDAVRAGEVIGRVGNAELVTPISGILRGLIRPGSSVSKGLKVGDVDPRGERIYCDTISEKARSLGGAVLEAVLAAYNQ
ncbi:MAG: selenium-dependent molybdenum cofactor biosynthesis protein YqeB [Desulfuromonadales bacterium]|jgi:xanthine dehydrogenase accessory factor|nr:selenium-dependent molybdenum cofactor biosynthesis protein YqeB [Desulfuromonadales bacterium]